MGANLNPYFSLSMQFITLSMNQDIKEKTKTWKVQESLSIA